MSPKPHQKTTVHPQDLIGASIAQLAAFRLLLTSQENDVVRMSPSVSNGMFYILQGIEADLEYALQQLISDDQKVSAAPA